MISFLCPATVAITATFYITIVKTDMSKKLPSKFFFEGSFLDNVICYNKSTVNQGWSG